MIFVALYICCFSFKAEKCEAVVANFYFSRFLLVISLAMLLVGVVPAYSFEKNEKYLALYYAEAKGYLRDLVYLDLGEAVYEGELDLYNCSSVDQFVTPKAAIIDAPTRFEVKQFALMALAYNVVALEDTLESAGYPDRYWRRALSEMETEIRQKIIVIPFPGSVDRQWTRVELDYKKIAKLVNLDPGVAAGSLPRAVVRGECGAGDYAVEFSSPKKSDIYLITAFEFKLCKKLRINPEDVDACEFWVTAPSGAIYSVAGIYYYKIAGKTGRAKRIDFDALYENATDQIVKLTLR